MSVFTTRGKRDYDLVILGGGSAGIVSGVMAGSLGLRTLLIEKHQMGGECLLTGCVPSKALLHAARVARTLRTDAAQVGLPARDIAPADARSALAYVRSALAYVRRTIGTVRAADATEKLLKDSGVTIRHGSARFHDEHTLHLHSDEGMQRISADNFLIATGSRPQVPRDIPGLDETPYRTNQTIFDLDEIPQRLLIVGGGPIGVEMAQAFRWLGSQVTLITTARRLLSRDDGELVERLTRRLRADGIQIHTSGRLKRIENPLGRACAVAQLASGEDVTLPFDCLLMATGRVPNVEDMNLDAAGVRVSEGGIRVDKHLRTTAPHVYACGDVIEGSYRFSHMAEYTAKIAVRNLAFPGKAQTDYRSAPWATFTEPELAHVGITEEEAARDGIPIDVYRQPFAQNDRALTDGGSDDPDETGLVKVLVEPGLGGRIRGVQILGPRAGEVIQEWVLAMEQGLSIRAIADSVHVYPTLTLASQHAAQRWYQAQAEKPAVRRALDAYVGTVRPRETALAWGLIGAATAGILWEIARRRGKNAPVTARTRRKGFHMADYYNDEDLARFAEVGRARPDLMQKFFQYYGATLEEGALSKREKALIGLAVAHAIQCPYCIDAFTQTGLETGANLEQLTEAIHVASSVRGGATLIHGLQALNSLDKVSM